MSVKLGNVKRLRSLRRMKVTDAIRALRTRAGLSMEETARLAGYKQASSYQRYEDESEFTKKWLPVEVAQRLIAAFAGKGYPPVTPEEIMALTSPSGLAYSGSDMIARHARVVGVVEAGVWREAIELPTEEQAVFPLPDMPGYEGVEVFGLRVRGPSMNKVYPDGSIAYFVRVPDAEPVDGDIVVVAAKRGELYETTLKEFGRDKKGRLALWPRSTDPRHQSVIYPDTAGAESVEVIGVAIGKFEPIRRPSRPRRR